MQIHIFPTLLIAFPASIHRKPPSSSFSHSHFVSSCNAHSRKRRQLGHIHRGFHVSSTLGRPCEARRWKRCCKSQARETESPSDHPIYGAEREEWTCQLHSRELTLFWLAFFLLCAECNSSRRRWRRGDAGDQSTCLRSAEHGRFGEKLDRCPGIKELKINEN